MNASDELLLNPYPQWIIASDYYDGSIAGIGERIADGMTVWFRAVAWDEEQWQRVFAVAAIAPSLSERLIQELEKVESRKVPYWLPGPNSATPEVEKQWQEIETAAFSFGLWSLVEAHALYETATEYPIAPADPPRITSVARSTSILEVRGPSLTDDFLKRIRSQEQ